MTSFLRNLWSDESGATMVEYALMVALIAIVCIAAVTMLGTSIRGVFTDSAVALGTAAEDACTENGGTWTPETATDAGFCTY
jgi:pilus assembly protein Flp/PilA